MLAEYTHRAHAHLLLPKHKNSHKQANFTFLNSIFLYYYPFYFHLFAPASVRAYICLCYTARTALSMRVVVQFSHSRVSVCAFFCTFPCLYVNYVYTYISIRVACICCVFAWRVNINFTLHSSFDFFCCSKMR